MKEQYWPYVVPLPKRREDRQRFLLKIFGSNVTIDILELVSSKAKIAQKELIEKLPYSNKTIVTRLNDLVSLGILNESMEKVNRDGRRVWIKQYSLTEVGKWVALLISPPETLEKEELEELLRKLFRFYVQSILELYVKYNLDIESFFKIVNEEIAKIRESRA